MGGLDKFYFEYKFEIKNSMNKLFLQITFLLLLGQVLSGCQKTVFKRTAKGVVLDVTTNEPIPFAKVSVYREQTEFLGPSTREIEASAFADEKGEFEIRYNKTNRGIDIIYASKENYDVLNASEANVTHFDQRRGVELKLQPTTKLRLVYKKNQSAMYVNCSSDLNGKGTYNRTVTNRDAEDTVVVQGNKTTQLYIVKDIPGQVLNESYVDIFCESNKITTYIINY